jgi:hypothetical protein
MAEFDETLINIKKKDIIHTQQRIVSFLMSDFEKKYNEHKQKNHSWFIQNTVHGICRNLILDKQLVVYLLLGANPRREAWNTLKDKYNIDPIRDVLRKEITDLGKKIDKSVKFKVYFTDTNRNGDFHIKVVLESNDANHSKKE